jgi:glycerol-3-phosphate acyltransferase PlsY
MHYEIWFATMVAYLFGSISSAVITCKLLGLPDPRTEGSGNPGATNVLRIGGKKAAIITLIGDFLKGVIPVLLAKWLGISDLGLALVTFAAFFGHLYPVFFKFQGGKGVATAFGCMTALSWPVGICLLVTWLDIAFMFRYSSLAALVTAIAAPFFTYFFTNMTFTVMAAIMSLLLIWRHRKNIKNLFAGKENKIGKKSKISQ